MFKNLFIIPNILSILKIPIALFGTLLFFYLHNNFIGLLISFIAMVLIGLLDCFDGLLARILDKQSKLGAFLDILSDKLSTIIMFFVFIQLYKIPVLLIILFVLRDLSVIIIACISKYIYKIPFVKTNIVGKLITAIIYIILPFLMLQKLCSFFIIDVYCLYIMLFLYIISGVIYIYQYIKLIIRN